MTMLPERDLLIRVPTAVATGYLLGKIFPVPNRATLIVIGVVNIFVIRYLISKSTEAIYSYSNKAGYVDARGHLTNYKYHLIGDITFTIIHSNLPLFYRLVGRPLKLEL